MNCQEVMELMQRQLDGDLDESEYSVLMSHTRHCPDCAAMYERLQLLSAELTSLPKVVPSYSLVDAILPELQRLERDERNETMNNVSPNEVVQEQAPARRLARSRRFPSLRVMGGIIAAGVVAGLFIISYNAGIGPSFDSSDNTQSFSADQAASNTAEIAEETGDVHSLKIGPMVEKDAMKSDVGTESMENPDGADEPVVGLDDRRVTSTSGSSAGGGASGAGTDGGQSEGSQPSEPSSESETANVFEDGVNEGRIEGSMPSTPGNQGIMGEVPAAIAATSPNGEMQAIAEGFKVKIYNVEDQTLLLETDRKNGKLAQLAWSDDNTLLNYEVQLEQGAIEKYVIDVQAGSDTKAQH